MADRPILMSAPMVLACLREVELPGAGKTQTRRILKPQPPEGARYSGVHYASYEPASWFFNAAHGGFKVRQRFEESDEIWVREAWRTELRNDAIKPSVLRVGVPVYYEAGGGSEETIPECAGRLRPGIHMPRWASRLTLTVTDVRVERLQAISRRDAIAEGLKWVAPTWGIEGIADSWDEDPDIAYAWLWESINCAGSWSANPWVCVVQFIPKLRNIDAGD